jgi:hypothetical protein
MTTKLTDEERAKLDRVEKGSIGALRGVARQRSDLSALCWRMAYEHEDGCRCWACVYVQGQRS